MFFGTRELYVVVGIRLQHVEFFLGMCYDPGSQIDSRKHDYYGPSSRVIWYQALQVYILTS